MYVAWLSIQYQAFTYSTASGTYGFSRVLMIFRFITIRATEPCLNLEYSGFRSRETNSPYNLIGGARRRLSSRDRVQPPLGPLSSMYFYLMPHNNLATPRPRQRKVHSTVQVRFNWNSHMLAASGRAASNNNTLL